MNLYSFSRFNKVNSFQKLQTIQTRKRILIIDRKQLMKISKKEKRSDDTYLQMLTGIKKVNDTLVDNQCIGYDNVANVAQQ